MTRRASDVRWEFAAAVPLDPERYLGERRDLPETAEPGDWCTIVVVDRLGEMRWTFVALEADRALSLFERQTARQGAAAALARLAGTAGGTGHAWQEGD